MTVDEFRNRVKANTAQSGSSGRTTQPQGEAAARQRISEIMGDRQVGSSVSSRLEGVEAANRRIAEITGKYNKAQQPQAQAEQPQTAASKDELRAKTRQLEAQINALKQRERGGNANGRQSIGTGSRNDGGNRNGRNHSAAPQKSEEVKTLEKELAPVKKQYLESMKTPTIVNQQAASTYTDTSKRNALLDRLNNLQEYAGYATDDLSAGNYRATEDELVQKLHEEDSKLGYAARDYTNEARLGHMAETAGRGILSAGEGFIGSLSDSSMADPSTMNELQRHRAEKNMELAQKMYGYADENDQLGAAASAQGKEGVGAVGRFAFDVGVNAIQTGADALAASTGLGMVPFFVRAAGGSMNEARRDGANARQTVSYGMAKGAVEVLTEKLFDGLGGVFGAGAFDDVVDNIAKKYMSTDAGRTVLRAIINAVGEGAEEAISDFADPLVKTIYDQGDRLYQLQNDPEAIKEFLEETVYDFGVGAAMSIGGTGLSIVRGQDARRNEAIRTTEAEQAKATAQQSAPPMQEAQAPVERQQSPLEAILGTLSPNARQVDKLVKSAEMQAAFEQATGIELEGGIGDRRRAVKEYYRNLQNDSTLTTENIDNSETPGYTNSNEMNGGVPDAEVGAVESGSIQDRNSSVYAEGVPGRQERLGADDAGREDSGRNSGVRMVVPLSEKSRKTLEERGVVIVEVKDRTTDSAAFSSALDEARAADPKHGWAVSPKSVEEITENNLRVYMNDEGSAGFALDPNGDIEAVFSNKSKDAPKGTLKSMLPQAIAMGGKKLDCYGTDLLRLYAQLGFEPVARVEFNPEYANDGWDESKGHPEIIFMIHNGDSADTVVENYGKYRQYTQKDIDALPYYGEDDYDKAAEYRDGMLGKATQKAAETQASEDGLRDDTLTVNAPKTEKKAQGANYAAQAPEGQKVSKTWENTLRNMALNEGDVETAETPLFYMPKSERQSLAEAVNRLETDKQGEVAKLIDAEAWSGVQMDMAMKIKSDLFSESRETGDRGAFEAWLNVIKDHTADTARGLQATAKYTRDGAGVVEEAQDMGASKETMDKVFSLAGELEDALKGSDNGKTLKTENREKLHDLILKVSKIRRTGAMFGLDISKALERFSDSEMLDAAYDSILGVVNDANNVGKQNMAQKFASYRVLSLLSGVPTTLRNVGGNYTSIGVGLMSQQTTCQLADAVLEKYTGQRVMPKTRKGKAQAEFYEHAYDAMMKSFATVALDIDMSGNSGKYGMGGINAYTASGGPVERFMHKWSQLMSYALVSSDSFFRGGIENGVAENFAASGSVLSAEQQAELAKNQADYLLFQNDSKLASGINSLKRWMNNNVWGIGGVKDSETGERLTDNAFGIGSIAAPFVQVPINVGAKVIEFGPVGSVKGFAEMLSIIHDSKINGGKIDPARQQKAVRDLGNGATGVALTVVSTLLSMAGVVKDLGDDDDPDVAALQKLHGKGVKINLTAALRFLSGDKSDWRDGDLIFGVEAIQPFDAILNIGANFADLIDAKAPLGSYITSYGQALVESVEDMPMFQYANNLIEQFRYMDNLDDKGKLQAVGKAFATATADTATSLIPQIIKNAGKAADPYQRDSTADNYVGYAWNQFKQNVPGLRQTLDVKLDNYGNPISAGTTAERILNSLILPARAGTYKTAGKVGDEALRLYEATGDARAVADRKAPNSIKFDGDKWMLTASEKRAYQQKAGEVITKLSEEFIQSAEYQGLTEQQRVESLAAINAYGEAVAKAELIKSRGETPPKLEGWQQNLTDTQKWQYIQGKQLAHDLYTDGKINDYAAMDSYLKGAYKKLPTAVKTQLDSSYGNLDKMSEALGAGISSKRWSEAKEKFDALNKSGAKNKVKADDFDLYLRQHGYTDKQRTLLEEQLQVRTSSVVEAKAQTAMIDAGMKETTANKIDTTIAKIDKLPGEEQVKASQKYQAIADMGLSDSDFDIAYSQYATTAAYNRMYTALAAGYSRKEWADIEAGISKLENTNKSTITAAYGSEIASIYKKPTKYKTDDAEESPSSSYSTLDALRSRYPSLG